MINLRKTGFLISLFALAGVLAFLLIDTILRIQAGHATTTTSDLFLTIEGMLGLAAVGALIAVIGFFLGD